jgi:hypothetical protein
LADCSSSTRYSIKTIHSSYTCYSRPTRST